MLDSEILRKKKKYLLSSFDWSAVYDGKYCERIARKKINVKKKPRSIVKPIHSAIETKKKKNTEFRRRK